MEDFSQEEQTQAKNPKKHHGMMAKAVIFLGIIIIVGLVAMNFYLLKELSKAKWENEKFADLVYELMKDEAPTVDSDMNGDEEYLPGHKLMKKHKSGDETIFLMDEYDRLAEWGDWLFLGDVAYGDNNDYAKVLAYNMETEEKKVLLDVETQKFYKETRFQLSQYVNQLEVIDNKLFITLGGYMMEGGVYYVDLEKGLDSLNFVGQARNPTVEKIDDTYIVFAGEGDACYSESVFYVINEKMDELVKKLEVKDDCGASQRVVGREGSKVYVADLELKSEAEFESLHKQIYMIDLVHSQGLGMFINDEQMPSDVTRVVIKDGKALLYGYNMHVYDEKLQKMTKISVPTAVPYHPDKGYAPLIFEGYYEGNICLDSSILVDLTTNSIDLLEEECRDESLFTSQMKNVEQQIEDMELSKEFYYTFDE
jgi:hypothetical protein